MAALDAGGRVRGGSDGRRSHSRRRQPRRRPAGVARATDPKANPFEKKKNAKSGALMWTEVYELAELLKSGKSTWEDLDLDDVDVRLKVRESDEQSFFWSFSHP